LVTFHFATFAWIFFRAPDLATASAILGRIGSGTISFANVSASLWLILSIAVLFHYLPKKWYEISLNLYVRAPFYAQAAAMAALVFGIQHVAQTGAVPFVYERF